MINEHVLVMCDIIHLYETMVKNNLIFYDHEKKTWTGQKAAKQFSELSVCLS